MDSSKFLITGGNGQLGLALRSKYPDARWTDVGELDITSREAVELFDWSGIKVVINAAAYTNVDGAETPEGRIAAWNVNAKAVKNLTYAVWQHQLSAIVHISTDYVFDGARSPHREDEQFSPLGVYGASKAAGDLLVSQVDKHYILRTSWVIGNGKNFVRTMLELGEKGISPTVVSDQIGRLTFTDELVRAVDYILLNNVPFGTYNVSNDGRAASWAEITRLIFEFAKYNLKVADITTAKYFAGKPESAPRPLNSTLDLAKLHALGFKSRDWEDDLEKYVSKELST